MSESSAEYILKAASPNRMGNYLFDHVEFGVEVLISDGVPNPIWGNLWGTCHVSVFNHIENGLRQEGGTLLP